MVKPSSFNSLRWIFYFNIDKISLAGKIFRNLDFTMSLEYIYFIEWLNYYELTLTWDVFKCIYYRYSHHWSKN